MVEGKFYKYGWVTKEELDKAKEELENAIHPYALDRTYKEVEEFRIKWFGERNE